MLPFSFELMIEKLPFSGSPKRYRFGKVPKKPDNLNWMMTNLSAELFFLGAVTNGVVNECATLDSYFADSSVFLQHEK